MKAQDKNLIFNFKQVPFNLNNLINAKNIYQSLETYARLNLSKVFTF